MLPKDLLEHLEQGDRTKEMLRPVLTDVTLGELATQLYRDIFRMHGFGNGFGIR